MSGYYDKYTKYKTKYLALKHQLGGDNINFDKISRGEVISGLHSRPRLRNNLSAAIFFLTTSFQRNKRFLFRCGLKETGCKIKITSFKEGIHRAKIFLDEAMAIENPTKIPQLGRFILFDKKDHMAGLGSIDV